MFWFSLAKNHIGWPCHTQQALGRRLSNWFTVCLTPLGPWTPLYPQCVCLCALGNMCACVSVCICVLMCWRKIETERKGGVEGWWGGVGGGTHTQEASKATAEYRVLRIASVYVYFINILPSCQSRSVYTLDRSLQLPARINKQLHTCKTGFLTL